MLKPLILFSQPRSGSTLLQRMLSAHREISSTSEPWLLLPLLYALRREGVYTEYSHRFAWLALQDMLEKLPKGRQDYLEVMAEASMALYARLCDCESRYFLDKTPRYSLVADDVVNMFEKGKFIFLWRNPLAVIASMIETWGGGGWNLYIYKVDLFDGIEKLVDVYRQNSAVALAVNYETLLQEPERELSRIVDYLGLEYESTMLETFAGVDLGGNMGDPTGKKEYRKLSTQPIHKWKTTISNPLRRLWCSRYLRWLGKERLAVMGYDLDVLLEELETTGTRWSTVPGDLLRFGFGLVYCLFDIQVIRFKLAALSGRRRLKSFG